MKDKIKLKGMTLIEVVIYLALFGVFFMVLINFYFFVSDSNELSGESLKLDRAVILLTQHLEDSFKVANGVSGSTVYNNDNGVLYLTGTSNANYSVSSDALQFYSSVSNTTSQLTRSDLVVTKFSLEEINDNSDTLIGVKVTIGLRSSSDNSISTEFTNLYLLE